VQKNKRSGTPSAANSNSRPPDPIVLFLDESVDNETVAAALQEAGAQVERATQHFPRGTADEIWLDAAGQRGWVVLTRDKHIRYRVLEKKAVEQAKVRCFVFTGGNVTMADTAAILVKALPKISTISAREAPPFIYHIGRTADPRRVS
jgi:predicted nuclease of predicted toxin-antitoxin system